MPYKPFLNQDYNSLKSECQRSRRLFQDDTFPPNEKSLSRIGKKITNDKIVWKRASEIVSNPQFVVNDISPNDLDQGQIGDCWLITGMGAVATIPEYISIAIPENQTFDSNDYAGIFHFRFWRFGEWIDVTIDDFLPVNSSGQLIFCHNNQDANEMFGPLMEKAYAKVNGCYQYLDGGEAIDAMIDLTGGVHESFQVKYDPTKQKNDDGVDDGNVNLQPDQLWEVMFKSYMMKSLAGASIKVGKTNSMEHVQASGLVEGHAYCIMDVFEILSNGQLRQDLSPVRDRTIRLLRMRNPWGQNKSWSGRWSAGSSEWRSIDPNLMSQINASDQTDGVFFISFDDFVRNFDDLDYVHVNMDAFYESDDRQAQSPLKWVSQVYNGEFVPGRNAGGCGNDDPSYYWVNPQYSLLIDASSSGKKTSVIVSLMQTEQTRLKDKNGGLFEKSNEALGFSVYRIVDNNQANVQRKLSSGYKFKEQELDECCSSGAYRITREISKRFLLAPGYYVIIPSLFDKDVPMKFLLRLFTKSNSSSSQPNNSSLRVFQPRDSNNNRNKTPRNVPKNNTDDYPPNPPNQFQQDQTYDEEGGRRYYNSEADNGNGQDDQQERYNSRDYDDHDDRGYNRRDRDRGRRHHRDRSGSGSRNGSRRNSRDRGSRDNSRDSRNRRGSQSYDDNNDESVRGRGRRTRNFTRPTIHMPDPIHGFSKVVSKACLLM